jgi:hypothetical protein
MPMVAKHIKTLLYDHDCVIIPEFGGLITRYVSASIHPVKHTIVPPSKTIAFNEKLVLNDGLLISTIAFRNNISSAEAQQMVSAFVRNAKITLDTEQKFELSEIGIFRYNTERKLVFEYIEQDNLLEASFGLPSLIVRPVRHEEAAVLRTLLNQRKDSAVTSANPFKRRLRRAYRVALGFALVSLTTSALYLLSLQTEYNLSSLYPISLVQIQNPFDTEPIKNRYAYDYVPFTQQERIDAYGSLFQVNAADTDHASENSLDESLGSIAESEVILSEQTSTNTLHSDIENSAVQEVIPEKDLIEPVKPQLVVEKATGRYYVISGGYSTQENAEVSRDAIIKMGTDAKVLIPGRFSKLYRVSVADFNTEIEAKDALSSLKQSFGETIWVFKN